MSGKSSHSKKADYPILYDLMDRYVTGTITEEDCYFLVNLFRNDPRSLELFRKQFDTHALLGILWGNRYSSIFGNEMIVDQDTDLFLLNGVFHSEAIHADFLADEENGKELPALSSEERRENFLPETLKKQKDPSSQKRKRIYTVAILCVLFLWSHLIYKEFHPSLHQTPEAEKTNGLARIVTLLDPVFDENSEKFTKGSRLNSGPITLQSGIMEIEYANGIRLVMEGPAHYQLESLTDAACESGKFSFYVPPEGKGFTVMTPKLTVRDLGTEFFLDVQSNQTELHVVRGEVQANWLTGEWLSFKTGRGLNVQESGAVRQIVAKPELFLSKKRVENMAAPAEDKPVYPEELSENVQSDSSILLQIDGTYRKGANDHFTVRRDSDHDMDVLVFKQKNDGIVMNVPQHLPAMTFMAEIRVDRLTPQANTLFSSTEAGDGGIEWELTPRGTLRLTLRAKETQREAEIFESPAVLKGEISKRKTRLTTVVDARSKTIRHYVDNRCVATLPMKHDTVVHVGEALLGNGDRSKNERLCLNGVLYGFALFDRALSAGEIQSYSFPERSFL